MEMVQNDVSPSSQMSQVRRFIERDETSRQSTGRINILRVHNAQHSGWSSFWADPFHSVIHHSTIKIIAFFCASYLFTHLVFSLIYFMIDASCQLQIESLLDAMYLSLEVGTTIGWGLPGSPYMKAADSKGGCMSGIFIIYLHTLVMQIQNAIMIGLMFCRLSRGTSRAASLIFTDKAVIREIGGKFFFMFQVCEQRKHQLVEAKIRCYALSTTVVGQTINGALSNFQNQRMRLTQPDDETGCYLHLAVPNLIIHEIDSRSPLYPEVKRGLQGSSSSKAFRAVTRHEIEDHMHRNNMEVVVLVEGFEPITAACTQGRQAYSHAAEDIAFDCAFAPCVLRREDGSLTVDFNRFQELVPAPPGVYVSEELPESG